jgi:hypothetical protein
MTTHLKSLVTRTAATVIALAVCAVAAFLLNRLIVLFDKGIKTPAIYVLPTLKEIQTPNHLSRVSF